MKILVTGTAGFIGFHLTKRLLDEDHEVVGVDSINPYYDINLKKERLKILGISIVEGKKKYTSYNYNNLVFFKANISEESELGTIFDQYKFDVVCNLAAQAGVRHL